MPASAILALSQVRDVIAVGPSGGVHYYGEVLPAVSAHYLRIGLDSSPYAAFLRLFGGATDVAPVIAAPGLVVPLALATSSFALLALARLAPETGAIATLVALPMAWYYYTVLALPQIVTLLRGARRPWAVLLATLAASSVLPLENVLLAPLFKWLRWDGAPAPPLAAVVTAVQPAGLVALLVLSVLEQRAQPAVPATPGPAAELAWRPSPSYSSEAR